jgi:hypothetical protein
MNGLGNIDYIIKIFIFFPTKHQAINFSVNKVAPKKDVFLNGTDTSFTK